MENPYSVSISHPLNMSNRKASETDGVTRPIMPRGNPLPWCPLRTPYGFWCSRFYGALHGCVVPSWGKQDPVNATSVPKQGATMLESLPKTLRLCQIFHNTDDVGWLSPLPAVPQYGAPGFTRLSAPLAQEELRPSSAGCGSRTIGFAPYWHHFEIRQTSFVTERVFGPS